MKKQLSTSNYAQSTPKCRLAGQIKEAINKVGCLLENIPVPFSRQFPTRIQRGVSGVSAVVHGSLSFLFADKFRLLPFPLYTFAWFNQPNSQNCKIYMVILHNPSCGILPHLRPFPGFSSISGGRTVLMSAQEKQKRTLTKRPFQTVFPPHPAHHLITGLRR